MKILASQIKLGNIIIFNDDLYVVSSQPEQTKPGKGRAYVQVEMKNFKTGSKLYERFVSDQYVEKAFLEYKQMNFLYFEGKNIVLMDNKTYEQVIISKDLVADKIKLIRDNMALDVEFYQNEPISLKLPQSLVFTVLETQPTIKNATATSSYKPAIVDGELKVMVPPYIGTGEKILVKTEDMSFIERVKS